MNISIQSFCNSLKFFRIFSKNYFTLKLSQLCLIAYYYPQNEYILYWKYEIQVSFLETVSNLHSRIVSRVPMRWMSVGLPPLSSNYSYIRRRLWSQRLSLQNLSTYIFDNIEFDNIMSERILAFGLHNEETSNIIFIILKNFWLK